MGNRLEVNHSDSNKNYAATPGTDREEKHQLACNPKIPLPAPTSEPGVTDEAGNTYGGDFREQK